MTSLNHRFVVVCLCLILSSCFAAGFGGGKGNLESPYKLSEASDIIELAENEGSWGAVFELTSDIDMAGIDIKPFTQDMQNGFGGTIRGNGFTIKNITLKGIEGKYVGLFGVLSATSVISDLKIIDVDIDVNTPEGIEKDNYIYVGALAGCSRGKLINCEVTGNIKARSKDLVSAGGFGGRLEGSIIDHCYAEVSMDIASEGQSFAGGMVGYCYNSNMLNNISNSIINAVGSERTYAGSISGYSLDTSFNSCCSDEGKILTDCGGYSGGITGYCYNGQIINCYAENTVFSFDNGFAGGLAGGNYNSIIRDCFFNGRISLESMDSKGGTIAGFNVKSQILNCFWVYDSSMADKAIVDGVFIGDVTMLTNKQIKAGGIFDEETWNADTPKDSLKPLWEIYENKLPTLNRVAQSPEK
ncbi:MAG: GLUG motif-containing protein [Sedimentisphaeraceae bacterium JB056]